MRFIHSLWSKPANDGVYSETLKYINPYLYGLSACNIKRLGHEIVLYTDNQGKEILGHLPYDEIHTVCESLDNINTKFFAYPKFVAMQHEGNKAVHIDGDVIIKSNLVPAIIESGNTITSYCKETNLNEAIGNKLSLDYLRKIIPNEPILLKHKEDAWYNTGLLNIKDKQFFEDYINTYFSYYDRLKDIIKPTDEFKSICPDLVIEQQLLYDMAKARGIKHTDVHRACNPNNDMINSVFIVHYIGWSKYMFAMEIIRQFKERFPKDYNNTVAVLKANNLLLDDRGYFDFTNIQYLIDHQPYLRGLDENNALN